MNRFMTLTAATALIATGTVATANIGLENKLERYVGPVDISVLSNTEQAQLNTVISGGGTFSEKRSVVKSQLMGTGAMLDEEPLTFSAATPDNNYEALEVEIRKFDPDFSIDSVDDETRLELQAIVYGNDSVQDKTQKIEGLLRS